MLSDKKLRDIREIGSCVMVIVGALFYGGWPLMLIAWGFLGVWAVTLEQFRPPQKVTRTRKK